MLGQNFKSLVLYSWMYWFFFMVYGFGIIVKKYSTLLSLWKIVPSIHLLPLLTDWLIDFLKILIYLFLAHLVFVALCGFSLVAASGACSLLRCTGFSCFGAWALGVGASGVAARGLSSSDSVIVVHRLSCSVACGIFPDRGLNLCPLHWQADSYPPRHQGNPDLFFIFKNLIHLEHVLEHTERYECINIAPIATWTSLVAQTVRNVRDMGSIPGLGKSPGEGNGNPLQYSSLVGYCPWGREESDKT